MARIGIPKGALALLFVGGASVVTAACGGTTAARCSRGTRAENGVCVTDTEPRAGCGPGTEIDGGRCVLSPPDASAPFEDKTPPTFAGAARAETSDGGAVLVSWQPATDDATPSARIVYEVVWGETADFSPDWSSAVRTAPGATHALVTGLSHPGTTYFFRARAIDEAGNADENSQTVSARTGPDVHPPQFSGCRAVTEVQHDAVRVEWDGAVDDGTGSSALVYEVWIRPASATGDPRDVTPTKVVAGATSVVLGSLSSGVGYTVLCVACDAAGNCDDNTHALSVTTIADTAKPVFGGATTATKVRPDAVKLTWNAATDDVTESAGIVYEIYAATAAGAEDFSAPTLVTGTGKTEAEVSALATRTTHFFVVRARDRAGNEDGNTVEVSVSLPVSFELDVQPIFTRRCAQGGCHTAMDPNTPPKQGMTLDDGATYANNVNVRAVEGIDTGEPGLLRVSTDGVLADSFLWRKITDPQPYGAPMPPAILGGPLPPEETQIIVEWLMNGAPEN